mgnify:CR=1 FL=1
MEAECLIEATRDALAHSAGVPEIVAEAWQAQALAEAVGSHLATWGPPELRAAASELSEAGSRGRGSHRRPPVQVVRAERMTAIKDPQHTLQALRGLLGESGVALVRVAATAEEDTLYWQCMEAIDAADVSGDQVTGLLRRLAERERHTAA